VGTVLFHAEIMGSIVSRGAVITCQGITRRTGHQQERPDFGGLGPGYFTFLALKEGCHLLFDSRQCFFCHTPLRQVCSLYCP